MIKTVVFICLVAVVVAKDTVISIDQDNHKHTQRGQAGIAVTGTYQVIGVDGSVHEVNYIADDKGFRVIGEGKVEAPAPAPAPVTYPPATSPPPVTYAPATSPPETYLPPESQAFFDVFAN